MTDEIMDDGPDLAAPEKALRAEVDAEVRFDAECVTDRSAMSIDADGPTGTFQDENGDLPW
ncbi:hypothetical protein [Kitasatospora sp. NPDC094015]|uniref:hypothetical protein n=1 Tax=Kitasatospora sp. NPDC094015 TaxID=3155205 RepID=UPI00332B46B0